MKISLPIRKLTALAAALALLCALALPAAADDGGEPVPPPENTEEPLPGDLLPGGTPQTPGVAANLRWENAAGLAAWDAAENAAGYNVMLLRAGEESSSVIIGGITAAAADLSRLLREQGAGSYSFRVQAVSADNLPGMWSAPCAAYLTPSLCFISLPYGSGLTARAVQDSFSPVQQGGSFSFVIEVNKGYFKSAAFSVTVNGTPLQPDANGVYTIDNITGDAEVLCTGILAGAQIPAVPEIATGSLPAGRMGAAYSVQLTAGDDAQGSWSAVGTLPPGLTLSGSGVLSGTPTRRGLYAFTVRLANSVGAGTKNFTVDVGGKHYDLSGREEAVWIRGSEDTLRFETEAELRGLAVDGREPELPCPGVSLDGTAAELSGDYLRSLTIGEHTLLLIFADGDGELSFSVAQADPSTAPSVTLQPADASGEAGGKAVFTVKAEGTLPLLCCWQEERDGQWINIPGANSGTLTLTALSPEQNGRRYRCVVTNGVGKTESESAVLTVAGELPAESGERSVSPAIPITAAAIAVLGGAGAWLLKRRKKAGAADKSEEKPAAETRDKSE